MTAAPTERRSATGRRVLFGVPGHRGEAYLAECLDSLVAQTHEDWVAHVSLDGPQPAMEAVAAPYLTDPRIHLTTRPHRLGWVDNINWLMDRVDDVGADFWCYQQQDDVLEPSYLEELLASASRQPDAAVHYTDIVSFGDRDGLITQPTVAGSALGRQLSLMTDHHAAVAKRGLTRADVLRDGARLRHNDVEDFSCDTVWLSTVARWGDLVRVPVAAYRKRYHGDNEHGRWSRWPEERRRQAWLVHCGDLLEESFHVARSCDERRLLYSACLHRLTAGRMVPSQLPERFRTPEGTAALRRDFFAHLRRERKLDLAALLGGDWPTLRRATRQWDERFR